VPSGRLDGFGPYPRPDETAISPLHSGRDKRRLLSAIGECLKVQYGALAASVPKTRGHLLDHLVGAGEQRDRKGKTKHLGCFEIDYQFDFCGSLDRQVCRLLALENAIDVASGKPKTIHRIGTICDQPSVGHEIAPSFGVELRPIDPRDDGEIERAINAFAQGSNAGLIVTGSPDTITRRKVIITMAARYRLPTVYPSGTNTRRVRRALKALFADGLSAGCGGKYGAIGRLGTPARSPKSRSCG
jgi:hypothetical protein